MLDPHVDPSRGVTGGGEPAYCPSCELRHTRRPDWLCPRCRMPVEADVPPPRAPRAVVYEKKFPAGSRTAGALLVASGAALAVGVARHPAVDPRWRILAVIVLAMLGVALLLKLSAARWIAAGVAIMAAVLVSEGAIRDRLPGLVRDPLPAALRQHLRNVFSGLAPARISFLLGFAVGSLLLILGRPRRVRIVVGSLLAAPLVVAEILRAFGR